MASFSCHVFGGTKRFRLERIVRTQAIRNRVNRARAHSIRFPKLLVPSGSQAVRAHLDEPARET